MLENVDKALIFLKQQRVCFLLCLFISMGLLKDEL